MAEYGIGEIVDITITGARVKAVLTGINTPVTLVIDGEVLGKDVVDFEVDTDAERVTITRLAPAEWPPQIGDLWRGKRLWFTRADGYGNPIFISGGNDPSRDVDSINQDEGPLTLVHREEASEDA
jgi:hypothetical protein